jgi:8-oxo-dGTP diphosphatase
VGFIFSPDYNQVLLMTKNRPDWQVEKLNGIGGKIEEDETDAAAMVRECLEECDLVSSEKDWVLACTSSGPDWEVLYYGAALPGAINKAKTTTDEPVAWYSATSLPIQVIDNLRWLIPLAINRLKAVDTLEKVTERVEAKYRASNESTKTK